MFNTLAPIGFAFFLTVLLIVVANQRDTARAAAKKAEARNTHYHDLLTYLLGRFNLNVTDPYLVRPGFDGKRCFHCFWPAEHGHDAACPWHVVRPAVEALFPPSERPTSVPPINHVTEPAYVDLLPRIAEEDRIQLGPSPAEYFGKRPHVKIRK